MHGRREEPRWNELLELHRPQALRLARTARHRPHRPKHHSPLHKVELDFVRAEKVEADEPPDGGRKANAGCKIDDDRIHLFNLNRARESHAFERDLLPHSDAARRHPLRGVPGERGNAERVAERRSHERLGRARVEEEVRLADALHLERKDDVVLRRRGRRRYLLQREGHRARPSQRICVRQTLNHLIFLEAVRARYAQCAQLGFDFLHPHPPHSFYCFTL
mmetsp:Transcript_9777/g.32046  ORF Transcript_9777/g.32046 Transcript_9777/m.32046 type:complete len:221 (+) Transcript_9777:541-1203(+)